MTGNKQLFTVFYLTMWLTTQATNVLAQKYIFGRTDLPTGTSPVSMVQADFNGDGKLDLAISNQNSNTVSILLGKPDGTFQPHVDLATGNKPVYVTTGDFNKDGKLDLAVANFDDNTVSILLGNGDGTFKPHVDVSAGSGPSSVAIGDFNGDGNADLAVTDLGDLSSGTVSILLGKGDGTFPTQQTFPSGGGFAQEVITADFNGDGKLDLAVINFSTQGVSILLGKGNGTFAPFVRYPVGVEPISIVAGDFNGDGKPDLAIANQGGTVSVLLNAGAGTFEPRTDYPLASKSQTTAPWIATRDLDGDGVLDLVVTNGGTNKVSVLAGNGDGTFQLHRDYGAGVSPASVTIGDFNGDGYPDLAVANFASNTVSILLGDGHNRFSSRSDYSAGSSTVVPNSVALGDFNKDSNLDMVVADSVANVISVLLNNGDGTFQSPKFFGTGTGPHAVIAGDFNGDGILDVATANSTANTVSVLLGDGDGTFQSHVDSGLGTCSVPVSLASGDFNGDGHLDLAVACGNSAQIFILLGNGFGGFSSTTFFTIGGFSPVWVTTGDFNGDGNLDLAIAAGPSSGPGSDDVLIALGRGDGTFQLPVAAYFTGFNNGIESVAAGDFNGDGKLDLAVANVCSSSTSCVNGTAGILLGNGDGTFQPHVDYPAGADPLFAITGDFNGDGKLDVATANVGSQTVSILLGNGDGTVQTHLDYATRDCIFLAAGELDNDDGLDLVAVNDQAGIVSVFSSTPVAALNPAILTFAGQAVETPSLSRSVSLTNPGTGNLNLSSIVSSGDYSETDNCGLSLKPGANCSLSVTFTPTTKGTRPGTLTLNDNARGGPQVVTLSGSGLTPSATLSATRLSFISQKVGTTSPPINVTLANNGNGTLTIAGLSISPQFAQSSNCGSFINAGSSCTISVTFAPSAVGTQSGVLAIRDDAGEGEQDLALTGAAVAALVTAAAAPRSSQTAPGAQPQLYIGATVAPAVAAVSTPASSDAGSNRLLSPSTPPDQESFATVTREDLTPEGASSAAPLVTLSTNALPFKRQKLHSTSAAKTITLTNTGNALLEIRGIATTTKEFEQSNNCGFSIPAAASCTIRVTFTPSKPGRRQGYLTIDAGNDGAHEVLLFGPGVEPEAESGHRESGPPSSR